MRRLAVLCDIYECYRLGSLLRRYRGFNRSAFTISGCLLTRSGINDDSVILEGVPGYKPPAPGTVLCDEAFHNHSWTGSTAFMFSNCLPGRDMQAGAAFSSENTSGDDSASAGSVLSEGW